MIINIVFILLYFVLILGNRLHRCKCTCFFFLCILLYYLIWLSMNLFDIWNSLYSYPWGSHTNEHRKQVYWINNTPPPPTTTTTPSPDPLSHTLALTYVASPHAMVNLFIYRIETSVGCSYFPRRPLWEVFSRPVDQWLYGFVNLHLVL